MKILQLFCVAPYVWNNLCICAIDNKENQFGSTYESILNEFKELIEAHLSLIEKNEELKVALSEVKIIITA